ncbi:MAG: nucleotidyltransferase family protein [Stellaceae bacterium]
MLTTRNFRLFCLALSAPRQGDEHRSALRQAVAANPRWEAVLAGARRHAVAPLLLAGLQGNASAVPDVVIDELRHEAHTAARHSLAQAAALTRLCRRFSELGLRVLVLKGIPLAQRLYGDPGLRSAQDIDLFVDPTDVEAADAVLHETGHRPTDTFLPGQTRAFHRRWFKEATYDHPGYGRVELHHRLTDLAELLPWDFASLWRERDEVQFGGVAVPVLGRRHLACYLCAHGAEHAWQRLRWLTDLAALLREPGELDIALGEAEAAGLTAPMLHAVTLAHDWLGLRVGEDILARARADRPVKRLDRILAHSYAGDAWHIMPRRGSLAALLRYSVWQRLYRLSIKPVWRYRLRLLRRELISPADWAAVPLPARLFWLYPLIRPFGWLLRRRLH